MYGKLINSFKIVPKLIKTKTAYKVFLREITKWFFMDATQEKKFSTHKV